MSNATLQQQIDTGLVQTLADTAKDALNNVSTLSKITGHGLRAVRTKAANLEWMNGMADTKSRHDYIDTLSPELAEEATRYWEEIMNA